ncbi:TetR/AcrR family transcriptional regulator [Nocardioides seonyuensis]|uniref:TetR/AcrR family transcriptional regulator n=1 Tax=Nocardioides seonyuensis TaxID=2518371 RepID=UPI001423BC4D|nr:TetR/AcrR family transcriptional regulator [Nocardioides seonyuensis]
MGNAENDRRPGRPRRSETDSRILEATRALVREHGPEAVNIAAVSARSGAARTTIYRRYVDRQALLGAAFETVTRRGGPPPGDSLEDKLAWLLARAEEVLRDGIGAGGVAALLSGEDPDFVAAVRRALAVGLQPVTEQVAHDAANGVLSGDVDPDTLVNLVLGVYLGEALRHGAPDLPWRARTAKQLAALLAPE